MSAALAAEVTPIPPVLIPPAIAPTPVPPVPETLPPAITLQPVPGTVPQATPEPSGVSPAPLLPPAAEVPAQAALPGAMPPVGQPLTGVPTVSQPLGPAPATETEKLVEEQGMYFNVADEDIREVVKQISRALGKNFILDDKSCKGKITIISERKMTEEEVWETFLSALDANGCTIRPGPAGLIRLIPTREAISNPIEIFTDESPYSDRFITRLITLKNISATDMANVIKALVSKEGNLFAYPVTNTLIVTDTGTNIDRLMKLIKELDREGPQEILEIIAIVFADAKDIAAKITQIFEEEAKEAAPARPVRRGAATPQGEGEEIPRIRKVIPDERTNSIIILASKRAIQDVRDLIKKLDTPLSADAGEIHVHYLKHAAAKDLAQVLSSLSGAVAQAKGKEKEAGKSVAAQQATSLLSGIEALGKWSVTADESTNALVITASTKDFQTLYDRVISKLDIPRRQVYVEAVIIELSVAQDQQFGLGVIGGKQLNVGGSQISLFGSNLPAAFLNPANLLSGTAGGVSNNTVTINTPGSTGGTQTTQLAVPAFFGALQLAQGNTDVNILSTPNILTLDNQEAEIKVGQKVPFPVAAATTIGGSLQTTFTREDVALTLKIKPQISESDTIRLEVTQEDREVLPQQEQPSIAAQAGPSTTERSIKTAIVANNAQTIVLGGLIKDKYVQVVNKIPILGDIPVLGWLFKNRKRSKQKVNMVVFLTPHIIRTPRDFLAILEKKISEKNAFVEENFSRSQRKQIRQSLAIHASHLLEYSPEREEKTAPEEQPTPPVKGTAPEATPKLPPAPPEEDIDLAL